MFSKRLWTFTAVLFLAGMFTPAEAIDIYKRLHEIEEREHQEFFGRMQQREEEMRRRMTTEQRIAEELRRARLERERARDEEVQRRLYNQGHLPGTWLYWFRYGR